MTDKAGRPANELDDDQFAVRVLVTGSQAEELLRRGLDFGGLTRLEKGHIWYPRSAPLRAELHLTQ